MGERGLGDGRCGAVRFAGTRSQLQMSAGQCELLRRVPSHGVVGRAHRASRAFDDAPTLDGGCSPAPRGRLVRYNVHMVSTPRPAKDVEKALREEMAERAARIGAMLDRWAAEDISDEPEWDVGDIQPMTLRSSGGLADDKSSR